MGILRGEDLLRALQGIDFRHGFIATQANDTWEAQRKAAIVAFGALDIVESHFHYHGWFDLPPKSLVLDGVSEKVFGKFANLGVGYPGVGFTNVEETIAGADCEGVIG